MATVLKQFVHSVRSEQKEQRRRGEVVRMPSQEFEASVEPQRRLATVVRESADRLAKHIEGLLEPQLKLMQGVQDYLAFDVGGLDESALALVQAGAGFIDGCIATQSKNTLRDVVSACDQILKECDDCNHAMKCRDESYKEFQHYEQKVAVMIAEGRNADPDKKQRNREKLDKAMQVADEQRRTCEEQLKIFAERRTVHARASLRTLLHTYVQLFAGWSGSARAVAELFEKELRPGVSIEVVGLRTKPELNGTIGTIQRDEGGRCVVAFDDGTERALRPQNVCPLDALSSEEELASASIELGPRVKVSPVAGPAHGYEAEVCAEGLEGDICDVFVGGQKAEVLEVSTGRARVRLPPGRPGAPLAAEVRTAGWRRHCADAAEAVRYFEPLQFGACGQNVDLSALDAGGAEPSLPSDFRPKATRREGLVHGIALTQSPLLPVARPCPAASCDSPSALSKEPHASYYFEVAVREVSDKRTNRTLSLGFAWPPQELAHADASAAASWARGGRLPDNASELSHAFVVGGDLPKWHLGLADIGKVAGWRPLLDTGVGTVLGALLEHYRDASGLGRLRLTIFQDGKSRCSQEANVPSGWAAVGAPHGVVDVCGRVTSVELHQDAHLPHERGIQAASDEGLPVAEQVGKAEK